MDFFLSGWSVLLLAFALDLILGDPLWLPHPVRLMGRMIEMAEPRFRLLPFNPTLSGGLLAAVLISGTWSVAWLVLSLAHAVHPLLSFLLEAVLVYYCLSARSLAAAAREVGQALESRDLNTARQKVGLVVGRDVDGLSRTGVAQGAVETVAENFVDGVLAPLFFAALGGAPLALAYKMVNTLDSMIGYKNEAYIEFGRVAARLDDGANYLPARFSVVIIGLGSWLLFGRFRSSLRTALQEGRNHSSPNAGLPEAAFAGALQARLGGPNLYQGTLVDKPFIGLSFASPGPEKIRPACNLMFVSSTIWVCTVSAVLICWEIFL
ncbi:MAG: adenosylcobinamide-phosphate synthase CbiB [Desulfohalobiaceae bacterium]|nr:adenosylcobinamide-phosphate synthase CbiB [Desulfohalobiaceae bacterium]